MAQCGVDVGNVAEVVSNTKIAHIRKLAHCILSLDMLFC